jgi:hypothetical protein
VLTVVAAAVSVRAQGACVAQIEMAYRVHEELEHAIVFFPSIANEILEGFSLSAVPGLFNREKKRSAATPNSPSKRTRSHKHIPSQSTARTGP